MGFEVNGRVSLTIIGLTLGFVSSASPQSVIDNIRPVGQVCTDIETCARGVSNDYGSPAQVDNADEEFSFASETSEELVAPGSNNSFDAVAAYQRSCLACHASGAAGAPLLGDSEAWAVRTEKGMEAVMSNVVNGFNAMPAKGMCMNCSEANLRAIVDYMIAQ